MTDSRFYLLHGDTTGEAPLGNDPWVDIVVEAGGQEDIAVATLRRKAKMRNRIGERIR